MENLIEEQQSFSGQDIDAAEIELAIRQGLLRVTGGSGELCEAHFRYTYPSWKPRCAPAGTGQRARLAIGQPATSEIPEAECHNVRNEWDISLSRDILIALRTEIASGSGTFDLNGVKLADLGLTVASGDLEASLDGSYEHLKTMDVDVASGRAQLQCRGTYSNLERVDVKLASGEISLALPGEYLALQRIDASVASGKLDLDLRGQWLNDADIHLAVVSGNVNIILPDEIGAALQITSVMGQVRADEFQTRDGLRVNQRYGVAEHALRLEVSVVSGQVTII